jgi:prepilin-type N-terminal cleavage/methylation domain-containing protein
MSDRKGFTLLELIIVVVIIGVLVVIAVPNYITFIKQSNAQSAQNNLMAIFAAEQRYYEDHNPNYCSGAPCAANTSGINQNLSLNISSNDPFSYSCSTAGSSYACAAAANDNSTQLILNPNAQVPASHVTCLGNANANYCPVICTGGPGNSYCPRNLQ